MFVVMLPIIIIFLLGCLIVWRVILNTLKLRSIKGPFIARYTDLWRLLKVHQGDMHNVYLELHQKYGSFVRVGPNCISISGPEALAAIYNISEKLPKSGFYEALQGVIAGKPYANLFNTTDETFHANIKKPVSRAYSMSTLVEFEPFVDSTTELFLSRLAELYIPSDSARPAVICDLGKWLQYYAFDVIGELTFSKRFGFLDQGGDVSGIIASFRNADYVITLGQMPWLDHYFRRPLLRWSLKPPTSAVVTFTRERITEKLSGGANKESWDRKDMLSRFLDAKEAYPDLIDDLRVLSYATSNVNAGADTTAITLTAIFYYLLKNPRTLKKLEEEVLAAANTGAISSPCVSWTSAQKLPYLDAVIKEALRIHPAVGLILERIVPPAGMTVYGIHIPGGTVIGANPWVIHRDKLMFGADADQWRPERWIDSDKVTLKLMNRSSLAFGGGTRTCIGKNISLLEMYKVVPAIIQKFELSLARPEKEWKSLNRFLVFQMGLEATIKLRNRS